MKLSRKVQVALLLGSAMVARLADAQVTGSFDGSLTGPKLAQPLAVAAALTQTGKAVTGTVALPGDPSALGGAYLVNGSATPKRITLSGVAGPVRFKWRGKFVGTTMQGKARVKGPGQKLTGTLLLTPNVSSGDGSSCDSVFNQNRTFFVDQVLGQALASCATCHGPGFQAQSTRLRVRSSDPLDTARTVALMIDPADPSASRILEKPLALLPHGGGSQIMAGSSQEQILMQWVDLVVQAHCN